MLYAGYQYDAETGLYYLNARMYDSKTARFIQEDTYRGNKTDPLSLNLYTYCANNPLKYEDPTGHNFIKGALSKGAKFVKKAAKKVVKAAKKVAKAAKTVAKKVISAVKYVVKTVVKYVTKAVEYVANKVQEFWNSPGETVQSVISDAQRALEEQRKALEAKIEAYQQSDTMKFALTATAVDNSMDASEKDGILGMLGDFVDAKLDDLSGLAGSVADFALNNKSFMIHSTLDVLGMLPGIGNFADGLNAVVYLVEGDMSNVVWSLAACLPLAGIATVGVKYTGKAADATITFFKNSDKLNGFLDTGKTALKKTGDFFSNLFKKADDVSVNRGKTKDLVNPETTGTVWDKISATSDAMPSTAIPSTFNINLDDAINYINPATGSKTLWTNSNATKHMGEYVGRFGPESWSVGIRSQEMLESYSASLNKAMSDLGNTELGRHFGEFGNWELGINTKTGVVFHARMLY